MGRTFPTSAATPVMLENLHSITGKVRPPSRSTGSKHCSAANQPLSILAGAVEALENRVRTVEGGQPSEDEESASTEDAPDDEGTDRGDHRIRRRHRGPLRRRRPVPAGLPRTSTTPSSAEPDEQFAAWVEELRGQGLTERIPADWREIPLVVSELQALRSAWLSCRQSSRHSFEWVYWHDALGRSNDQNLWMVLGEVR